MTNYTEYHHNPDQYPFLSPFLNHWREIQAEYNRFLDDDNLDFGLLNHIMTPKSDSIKTRTGASYSAFGILFNGLTLQQFIDHHRIVWKHISAVDLERNISMIEDNHFQQTRSCLKLANQMSQNRIRTVYFSVFAPGLDIKLHTNNDFHTYRGYLGLKVPDGNVAMKICGETLYWQEGQFKILDHAYPHCPHNLTNDNRVALIVDFLKPEKSYEEMLALEDKIVSQRMKENPYSLGVFGKDDVVADEVFKKYGLEHQLTWNENLS
jgi:aspartyl/asparaginyl beta-hydroxylase (cupin superfamily)